VSKVLLAGCAHDSSLTDYPEVVMRALLRRALHAEL
jgi:hypothetical protein